MRLSTLVFFFAGILLGPSSALAQASYISNEIFRADEKRIDLRQGDKGKIEVSVTCPSDSVAISGGFELPLNAIRPIASGIDPSDSRKWNFTFRQFGNHDEGRVYAICARTKPLPTDSAPDEPLARFVDEERCDHTKWLPVSVPGPGELKCDEDWYARSVELDRNEDGLRVRLLCCKLVLKDKDGNKLPGN